MKKFLCRIFPCDSKVGRTIAACFEREITATAGQMAFFMMLSIFPFLIFLLSILSASGLSSGAVFIFLNAVFPGEAGEIIVAYAHSVSSAPNGGTISVTIIIAIFSTAKYMKSLKRAAMLAYPNEKSGGYIKNTLLGMSISVILGLIIILSVLLGMFYENIAGVLVGIIDYSVLGWLIPLLEAAFAVFALALIYLIICPEKFRFRNYIPGAVVAVIGIIIGGVAMSHYARLVVKNSAVYGAVSSIMVFALWLYVINILLVAGLEFNRNGKNFNK